MGFYGTSQSYVWVCHGEPIVFVDASSMWHSYVILPCMELKQAFAETRVQLDELAQQAEGSHRQHMERSNG